MEEESLPSKRGCREMLRLFVADKLTADSIGRVILTDSLKPKPKTLKERYEAYINSPKWGTFRLAIIAARGNKCEYCGLSGPGLHLHHLTYARLGCELPKDVKLACVDCHRKIHEKKAASMSNGKMEIPTNEQILNDELGEPILREDDTSWRHGSYRTEVYHRTADETYWQVCYRVSTDGETNELREGLASVGRVYPHEVTTVVYRDAPYDPSEPLCDKCGATLGRWVGCPNNCAIT